MYNHINNSIPNLQFSTSLMTLNRQKKLRYTEVESIFHMQAISELLLVKVKVRQYQLIITSCYIYLEIYFV